MAYKHLKFPEGSKFLVTGGAGFIGSNLCEAILNLGYKVRCLDDLSTGKQKNVDIFLPNWGSFVYIIHVVALLRASTALKRQLTKS